MGASYWLATGPHSGKDLYPGGPPISHHQGPSHKKWGDDTAPDTSSKKWQREYDSRWNDEEDEDEWNDFREDNHHGKGRNLKRKDFADKTEVHHTDKDWDFSQKFRKDDN